MIVLVQDLRCVSHKINFFVCFSSYYHACVCFWCFGLFDSLCVQKTDLTVKKNVVIVF